MDPMSLITGGLSLFGTFMSYGASQKMAEAQKQVYDTSSMISQAEMDVNAQKHQQMLLTGQRQQMQNIRNMQLARSMAVSSATNQGAQFGTGLQGGLGQISGQGGNEVLGLNQNLTLGNKVFSDDQQIGAWKMGIAGLQGQIADDQGQAALGSAISQASGPLGRIFGNIAMGGKMF